MATEGMRGCGFRKVGGLYLVGGGIKVACDRLPYELHTCPTCNEGVKFSRGFSWIDWYGYAGEHNPCSCVPNCSVCHPAIYTPLIRTVGKVNKPYGLLWVGEGFYETPQDFVNEAIAMGVSKRIAAIPRNLKLGETVILLAHRKVMITQTPDGPVYTPGVFYSFIPHRVEQLIWRSEAVPEAIAEMVKKGITPVIIPDGDEDHDPKTSRRIDKDRLTQEQSLRIFSSLREKLNGAKSRTPEIQEEVTEVSQEEAEIPEG